MSVETTDQHEFEGDLVMLSWAIAFFILALVAAVLGFGGIAGASAGALFINRVRERSWLPDIAFEIMEETMLRIAIIFLVIALIAAVLGFGGIAGASAGIAKILALIFVVLFLISLLVGRGRKA